LISFFAFSSSEPRSSVLPAPVRVTSCYDARATAIRGLATARMPVDQGLLTQFQNNSYIKKATVYTMASPTLIRQRLKNKRDDL